MSYKVVSKDGVILAYGPNVEEFEPTVPAGATLEIRETDPSTWERADKRTARREIGRLESEQMTRLTARGDREFRLAVYQALSALPGLGSLATHPAFLALKALDDAIKVERAKL
jgi:hypothetical protein